MAVVRVNAQNPSLEGAWTISLVHLHEGPSLIWRKMFGSGRFCKLDSMHENISGLGLKNYEIKKKLVKSKIGAKHMDLRPIKKW